MPDPITQEISDIVEDQIDEQIEETDDLLQAVTDLSATNTREFQALNERITECLTRTEVLSNQQISSESPLLVQLLALTTELKAEISSLKSSVESTQTALTELRSPVILPVEEPPITEETIPENAEVENPARSIENPPTTERRKNRFV